MVTSREANKVWSWIRLAAEATVAAVWVITIVSVMAGQWPGPMRWFVLLSSTCAAMSGRLASTRPMLSTSMLILAAVLVAAGLVVSRQ